ncbi:MAG TPA: DUF6157 family protein [Cryptosporangiaceae bacterium]|nr:DUF6157 family protein [Cryptosporangiaceae bacterium]
MNYYQTLIAVAEDCPVTSSVVPVPRGGKRTVAVEQYELLAEQPGRLTQEDVLFMTWLRRQAAAEPPDEPTVASLRERFFSQEQPCLRASPLPKKYGFGLLFDRQGLVSLCPVESPEYGRIIEDPGEVKILKAMRSARR